MRVKNPCWPRVSNKKLLEIVNDRLKGKQGDKEFRRLSKILIERQMALYAHIIRSEEEDPMKTISITEQGERVKADFRRAGRPIISGMVQLEDICQQSSEKRAPLMNMWQDTKSTTTLSNTLRTGKYKQTTA